VFRFSTAAANAMESFRATVSMFSGVPDPVFGVPDSALLSLNNLLQNRCSPTRVADSASQVPKAFPENLGYRGIQMTRVLGSDTAWQNSIWAYEGTLRMFRANPPSICRDAMLGATQDLYLRDDNREVEKLLALLARNTGAVTQSQYESIYSVLYNGTTLTAPGLVSPAQNAAGVSVTPTLIWNAVTGAATYQVQVATDSLFMSLLKNDSNLTATSRSAGALTVSTGYFWRVRARVSSGAGP
jgi:hypothetical protein